MRNLRNLLIVGATGVALALTGCGGDDGGGEGGSDADAATDAGEDGGADTGTDTGEDTVGDTGEGGDTDTGGGDEFATVTFFIDDSANQSYIATDGLAWKGSFSYDSATNILSFDGAWGGPFVNLWDDGPLSGGGHEPEDGVAGDHIWSVAVLVRSSDADQNFEYGAISGSTDGSDGSWIWSGSNGTFTVPAGSTAQVDAAGLVLPKWGWIDMKLTLDTNNIDPSFAGDIQLVEVKSSAWGWVEIPCTDEDGDGAYEAIMSDHVGQGDLRHAGLLNPGDQPEFVFVVNDIEYKVGGQPPAAEGGVSAAVWLGGAWVDQEITYNDKGNTIITVPWAPNPGHVAIGFSIDDSANMTYDDTDGLAWKGSFSYDMATRMITFDGAWGGPFVGLFDDGPWNEGGHEPAGATAGDHIWGITVWYDAMGAEQAFEYGAIRGSVDGSDGEWIWKGANGTFTVPADNTDPITATGLVIEAHGEIDLRLQLDTAALHTNFSGVEIETATVKGNAWGWKEVAMADDGTGGDTTADDDVYTFVFSQHLGKHDGLLKEGDKPEFVFVINGVEYKDAGTALSDGVTAWSDFESPGEDACVNPAGSCKPETISINPDNKNTWVVIGSSDEP